MTVYYLDSSAWLRRYFAEAGTRWVQHLFARHQPLASSRLGYVEVAAALARQQSTRPTAPDSETDLLNAFEAHWRELLKVEIDEMVFDRARALAWEKRLRGADAIHLAAADSLRAYLATRSVHLALLTADMELTAAARSLGIDTRNPADQEQT